MPSESVALPNIAEHQVEAAEARHLASTFKNGPASADFLAYAATLEGDASSSE